MKSLQYCCYCCWNMSLTIIINILPFVNWKVRHHGLSCGLTLTNSSLYLIPCIYWFWLSTNHFHLIHVLPFLRYNLGDGARPKLKWAKLLIETCEALFIQMQPYLITHLKFVPSNLMLIMLRLVLSIGFLQNTMDLLVNVLDPLKKNASLSASV